MGNKDTGRSLAIVDPETKTRIEKALSQLENWADEQEIPWEAVTEMLRGDEAEKMDGPPFHTSVVWADTFSPDGIKWHVVVRAGATMDSVLANIGAANEAVALLCEEKGWQPADRLPKSPAQVKEDMARLEAKLDASAAQAQATPSRAGAAAHAAQPIVLGDPLATNGPAPETKTIKVDEIIKTVTQTGKVQYKVKGFPWTQWGVTCWPDTGQIGKLAAVVNLETWETGTSISFNEVDIKAVVRLKPGDTPDRPKPDKVIDFVGSHALSELPSQEDLQTYLE